MSEQPVVVYVGPEPMRNGGTLSAGSVRTAASVDELLATLNGSRPACIVCDHAPADGADGLDILESVRSRYPDIPFLLCTDEPDGTVAARATQLGVTEYIPRAEVDLDTRLDQYREPSAPEPATPPSLSEPFEAIADSISDALVTIDAESRIVFANEDLADLTGYDTDGLVGSKFVRLIPERLREAHEDGLASYLETGERSVDWDYLELPLLTADGTELTVAVSFGDFELDGSWYCTGVIRNISDRKERERALAETNRRLDLALDGTDTGVYEWNLGTGEVVWDEATAELFGTDVDAFDGTVEAFHEHVHSDDSPALAAACERAREHDEQFEAEFRTVVDGETRWIYTNGVIEERDAQSPRLVAIASDITDQKSRERELARNNESLQELTQLATDDSLTEDEILDRVLELGADRLDLSLGYLSRIDGSEYEVVSVVGDHDVVQAGVETELSNTYCRRIVEDDRDQFGITDAAAQGWDDDMAYQMSGIACYLGGKVVVDGELYGTLCFADEEPRTEPFSESEQTFTRLLAEWTSRELERRQRKADLEQYESVIEAVDDGIYALDETGHFQLVNDAMTALTGYDADELLGAHTSHIKSDEVVERAESIVREMIFDDQVDDEETFDLEILRADGSSFPAEDHMTLLWDENDERFEGTAGIIRDITERKERERKLREANRRIERILGRIGAAFFAVDDDWTLTYWNHRAEEVLGRPAEEVMGEDLWEMFPDAVDARFYDAYHEAMATQEPVDFEEYYPPVDKWFRVNAYPSDNGLSVYFHDISDQKERDRKLSGLLETTRSLMQAQTAEDVAETVAAAAESELGFDLNLVRLYDPETGTLEPVAATDGVPERPVYEADEAFPGEAYQRGETVRVDDFDEVSNYDNRRANAAMYVPLGGHGVLSVATYAQEHFSDADVSVAEILASNAAAALDRVEREQDLLRYETVIENVRDMVYVLDEGGQFQLVTEALADWLGYEREELLNRHPRTFLGDQTVQAFARQIRRLRDSDESATAKVETTLLRKNGDELPAEIELSLIDNASFRGTAGVVRDRTELEQTREELRDERDRFSYLFNNLPDAVVEMEFDDDAPLVRSVNPAFTEVFGLDRETVVDGDLNEYVLPPNDDAQREADRLDQRSADGETVQAEIRRRTADGFRDFLFRGVPYRRDDGRVWSFGIYTDITEQIERERRLEVLNRVLRHNLRNDLTVVLGLADELYERTDDERHRELLGRLLSKAEQIASLSDRAREIERSVRRDDADTTPLDVTDAVESVATQYATQHGLAVSLSIPDTSVMAADGRLRRVVVELLENSQEHAGDDPTVSVDVDPDPETVSITVADDGPGIPDHELDVLTGTEPITQLSHGSGLGLWLVIWVVESYGGTVRFENTADGASITLVLPRTDI